MSLDEMWRSAIVADRSRTFAGRYPFVNFDNDASFPEVAPLHAVGTGFRDGCRERRNEPVGRRSTTASGRGDRGRPSCRVPLPDDAMSANPHTADRQLTATKSPETMAPRVTSGGRVPSTDPHAAMLPPVTMASSSDAASRPFGYALRLLGDALALEDIQ
ncbi:hypothetical protein [Burkholderia sp. 22PA0106]|uniref:hypothetical protein n=1 Tax=Burkholderia sp. 22PA0106 TaxID=3237371 RepID=UPI0039C4AE8C